MPGTTTPPTRRSLRRGPTPPDLHGTPTRVVVRPARSTVLLAASMACVLPIATRGRAPSLLDRATEAGPGSRQMSAVLLYWGIVVLWTLAVLIRSRTSLTAMPGRTPAMVVQTPLRRRRVDLATVDRVVLATVGSGRSASRRVVLLDGADRVVGTPGVHRGFWTRPDARALLGATGITVSWDHRISRWRDLEARYPGASSWSDRHPVLLAVVVVAVCLAGILGVAWLFEF